MKIVLTLAIIKSVCFYVGSIKHLQNRHIKNVNCFLLHSEKNRFITKRSQMRSYKTVTNITTLLQIFQQRYQHRHILLKHSIHYFNPYSIGSIVNDWTNFKQYQSTLTEVRLKHIELGDKY